MQTALPLLAGMLMGILITRWLVAIAHRNTLLSYHSDDRYEPVKRAVVQHFRAHGTLNRIQFERMMNIDTLTALPYLGRMVKDGLLKQQGHPGTGIFYTLV